MDARRSPSNIVSESFFYTKMFNPRRPHTPDNFTLEMKVNVERLRTEIILSQPAPRPQCDPTPRRLPAVDTGSEEPGTLRRSPAIGTGSDEPGVSRAETTEKEEIVPFETSMDGFLRFNCTSPDQEDTIILLQPDVGVDDEKETTGTPQQVAAREEFVRPTKKRQRQRTTAWTTEQSKQFDRGRPTMKPLLSCRKMSCYVNCLSVVFLVFCLISIVFLCYPQCPKAGMGGSDDFYSRMRKRLGCTRCVNCCTRTGASVHRRLDLRQRRVYSVPHCLLPAFPL